MRASPAFRPERKRALPRLVIEVQRQLANEPTFLCPIRSYARSNGGTPASARGVGDSWKRQLLKRGIFGSRGFAAGKSENLIECRRLVLVLNATHRGLDGMLKVGEHERLAKERCWNTGACARERI